MGPRAGSTPPAKKSLSRGGGGSEEQAPFRSPCLSLSLSHTHTHTTPPSLRCLLWPQFVEAQGAFFLFFCLRLPVKAYLTGAGAAFVSEATHPTGGAADEPL